MMNQTHIKKKSKHKNDFWRILKKTTTRVNAKREDIKLLAKTDMKVSIDYLSPQTKHTNIILNLTF